MSKIFVIRSVSSVAIVAAFAAALFILIGTAQALNTYSIDLERNSNQYLSITDANQTGLDVTGDMTMEAWVKVESAPSSGQNYPIITKDDNSSNRSYDFWYDDQSGTKLLHVHLFGSSFSYPNDYLSVQKTADLGTGTWHHIAAVVRIANSDAQKVEFFVDGQSIGYGSVTDGNGADDINNGGAAFEVGKDFAGEYFDGLIDEVRVWNRARSAVEVGDDYQRELYGNESGLAGYWKLNNDLLDSTTNNNDFTNNGSAVFSSGTPFAGFSTAVLKVRKTANESVSGSTVLQNDDSLKLSLAANKTYIVDGVIMASSTSATPDITLGVFGQSDSDIRLGYTSDPNEVLLTSGGASSAIAVPANTPTAIMVKGTITTGSTSGEFQLKWAQATSNGSAVTVMEGSYLRAEEM